MKRVAVALLCAGTGLIATVPAFAAAPAYCALYAREYAASKVGEPTSENAVTALQRVQDQAYFRCLNADEDPEFPATSAYFGASIDAIAGDPTGGEGDASAGDETLVADPPAAAGPPPVKTAAAAPASSGLKPWSPEWITWCKAHYHSFNAKTGMVVTLSGVTRQCP